MSQRYVNMVTEVNTMLRLSHISKVYSSKQATEVQALKDINITFEKTGMVFFAGQIGQRKIHPAQPVRRFGQTHFGPTYYRREKQQHIFGQ